MTTCFRKPGLGDSLREPEVQQLHSPSSVTITVRSGHMESTTYSEATGSDPNLDIEVTIEDVFSIP